MQMLMRSLIAEIAVAALAGAATPAELADARPCETAGRRHAAGAQCEGC